MACVFATVRYMVSRVCVSEYLVDCVTPPNHKMSKRHAHEEVEEREEEEHIGAGSLAPPPAKRPAPEDPTVGFNVAVPLCPEQEAALNIVTRTRLNVCITGGPGTGKSVLLTHILRKLKAKWVKDPDAILTSSSTAGSAFNLGVSAVTFHSALGLGLGDRPAEKIARYMKKERRQLLKSINVLILDEYSMISDQLLDLADGVLQRVRGNKDPFGGVQLVVFGDALQLPPVSKDPKNPVRSCIFARAWRAAKFSVLLLRQIHRTKDAELCAALADIRVGGPKHDGVLLPSTLATLRRMKRAPPAGDQRPYQYPHVASAKKRNAEELGKINDFQHTYTAVDKFSADLDYYERESADRALSAMPIERSLALKKGARVMYLVNTDQLRGLVNNALGTVIGFEGPENWPIVRFDAERTGTATVKPTNQDINGLHSRVLATRTQIPLTLAWGITTHKCQGMTMKSCVHLLNCFESGQIYVALSRGRDLEDTIIMDDVPVRPIKPPLPEIIQWYEALEKGPTIEEAWMRIGKQAVCY